jgi:hypothetical protein
MDSLRWVRLWIRSKAIEYMKIIATSVSQNQATGTKR